MQSSTMAAAPLVNLRELFAHALTTNQPPSLDLQWDDFAANLDAFSKEMDNYARAAKTELSSRASHHDSRVRELSQQKEETEQLIQVEQQRERDMLLSMESERQAASVLSTAVAQTSAALAKMREKSKALEEEIAAVRNETRAERATKERAADALDGQRQRDLVEVEAFQNALGLSITSCGGKRLLIVFTSIDPARPKREFMFVFDMGSEINAVPQCDPPLPQMNELVRQFNADHDLSAFIKRVRKAFVAVAVPPSQSEPTPSPLPVIASDPPSANSRPSTDLGASVRRQSRPSPPPTVEANLIEI